MTEEQMTVEQYEEWQKEVQSWPQEKRIALIIGTFKQILGGTVHIMLDKGENAYPFVFVFKDQELLADINREMALRTMDKETRTKEETVKYAHEQLDAYRQAPAIYSVLNALMSEIGEPIASTYLADQEADCMVICKDPSFAEYLFEQQEH